MSPLFEYNKIFFTHNSRASNEAEKVIQNLAHVNLTVMIRSVFIL